MDKRMKRSLRAKRTFRVKFNKVFRAAMQRNQNWRFSIRAYAIESTLAALSHEVA